MADLSQIRNFPLKVIFIIHFIFISLSTLGYWCTTSYLFYNFVFIFTLLWGIHQHDSEEPLQIAVLVNIASVVLDIFILAMCFPNSDSARERFSAAIAIIHLIVRPFTSIFLSKILQDRYGITVNGIRDLLAGSRQRNYEDIDSTHPPPQQQGSYNFPSAAQQI